jgi:protein-L-isoaspartate(D-aspartate) O-methyltransferase
MSTPDFSTRRQWMVRHHVAGHGIDDSRVLDAMLAVPREIFLPESLWELAYENVPLPIAEGRMASQPDVVAEMIAALALKGGEKVLEIGTAPGYAAAVLSRIAGNVYTVEPIAQFAEKAAAALSEHGFHNVHVLHAEEHNGWPDHAPYDAILMAEARPAVPKALMAQLKIGGRLVAPVGIDPQSQMLVRITRNSAEDYAHENIAPVRASPLPDFGELNPDAVHARRP